MNKKPDRPQIREVQRYATFGVVFGFLFPVLSTLIRIILSGLPINLFNALLVQRADPLLWVIDSAPLFLGAFAAYAGQQLDRVSKINHELAVREEELKANQINLESSVKDRTTELELANNRNESRARQFEAIGQVTSAINQTKSIDNLLPQIAQVISQQFHFYHVGIFLIDSNSEYALLVAANSEGGQKMLARNHKLIIGQEGIVGDVAGTHTPRIALDTGADAIYFNNPDLPATRSEMALPLFRDGTQIIGVLDIQSDQVNAFGQEDIQILATLADQVSNAIGNARLAEEIQKNLLDSETLYRSEMRIGWRKFSRSQKLSGIRKHGMKTDLLLEPISISGTEEVTRSGNIQYTKSDNKYSPAQMTIPMKLRGEVVGILNIRSDYDREWSPDEMDIITAIIERAALSIENARLLNESQRRAMREQTIGQISSKIGAGTEIETILKTAIRELGTQIGGAQITVEIGNENE